MPKNTIGIDLTEVRKIYSSTATKGMARLSIMEQNIILGRNQAYIIPMGEAHSYGALKRDPWSIYWLHFKGINAEMFTTLSNSVISIKDTDSSRQLDRLQLFEEIYQNLEMGYHPENLEYISFCLMYFLASIKYLNQYREINKVKVNECYSKVYHVYERQSGK